jgi:hypothetical protein
MSVEFDFATRSNLQEFNRFPFIAVDFSQRCNGNAIKALAKQWPTCIAFILAKAKTSMLSKSR